MSYTLLRLVLFLAALILLYLVGARGLLLFGLALLASGIISFVALSRQRDAMAGALTSRVRGFRQRLDEGSRAEDED
jgi:Mn2+/Fe2+ NRAMP family transporter